LIAIKGKVVYQKSFGYHTYEKLAPVRNSDLYDLASVTKIAATTISVMKLYEEGKIKLDDELVKYLPEIDSSNKEHLIIRQIMTHQARLKPFIPFYKYLMVNGKPDSNVFRTEKSTVFPYRVAENLYIRWDYPDTLFEAIVRSDLRDNAKYKYSDLGFYFMKRVVEKTTNETIDEYVLENFYKPLGLTTMCYQPRNYFNLERIIPSELDTNFRKQVLQGDVNDPGAAMCGGIQGHAGLFSNSNDLAILLQMLIQGGEYGGKRYYSPETVKEFTSYQFKNNRRGLGFDKPVPDRDGGPSCKAVSDESFGHSGFTGTYVWADPRYEIVYVFLSNRTYPYSENNKLLESGIRTEIQSVIYRILGER
jgi:CubicO group peptidase (beta-lactamase class C family)